MNSGRNLRDTLLRLCSARGRGLLSGCGERTDRRLFAEKPGPAAPTQSTRVPVRARPPKGHAAILSCPAQLPQGEPGDTAGFEALVLICHKNHWF